MPNIQTGMVLDVLSMFPLHLRQRVSQSRFLMVCCFEAPQISSILWECCSIQNFISVCSEIRSMYGSDFEMILVAKMRHRFSNHIPSFNHFFSAFPSFCHIVPFSQPHTRHLLCSQFVPHNSLPKFTLLQRSSTSSTLYTVLRIERLEFFKNYGADWFPFYDHLLDQHHQLHHSLASTFPSKFAHLLGPLSSQLQVFKFGGAATSLSHFQSRVVGLYLCADGSLIRRLDQVYRQCKDRGLDFEVVMVYMPFSFPCNLSKFIDIINEELHKLQGNTSSWWIIPFTDSFSRRLLKICPKGHDLALDDKDELVIFGPDGEYADPHAGVILDTYGIDVYPFTRNRLIQWELEKVRSLTLESLLVYGDRDYVLGKDNNGSIIRVPVSQLRGRIILFLFGCYPEDYESLLSEYYAQFEGPPSKFWSLPTEALLCEFYAQLKSAHPGFEVVSVTPPYDDVASPDTPWLVCPFEPEHSACVAKILGCVDDYYALVAFGEDGRVSSYRALDLLDSKGVEAFPFQGDLHQEVITELSHRHRRLTIFDEIMEDLNIVNTVCRDECQ